MDATTPNGMAVRLGSTRASSTGLAHDPKVVGSIPTPATIWKARRHWDSGPSSFSPAMHVYRARLPLVGARVDDLLFRVT